MYAVARSASTGGGLGPYRVLVPPPLGIKTCLLPAFGRCWIKNTGLEISKRRKLTTNLNVKSQIQSLPPPPSFSKSGTTSTSSTRRPLYIRLPLVAAFTLLTFTLGFSIMGAPALPTAKAMVNPPTDEETLTIYTPTTTELEGIESQIFSHPLTRSLLQDGRFTASRPHLKIPEAMRHQNLTGGTLLGGDMIAVPPVQFQTADGAEYVSLQYLGNALCGHPGIVHGGLLATLLDEGLGRCCFPALPNKVAVTASLKIDYKKPVMARQIVVMKAETTKVEGRKAWVKGRLESLPKEGEKEGVVLVEGEALFIEPRQAATMKAVVT